MSSDPYTSNADHHIYTADKTYDDVHLTSTADKTDDVVHQTSTGAKTFHVDHAAHGHNNENQKNFESRQMRMILNSLRRKVQTIQREV